MAILAWNARGLGGLALWWTEEVKVTILNYCKNYIDVSISYRNSEEWHCTFIYAPPYHEEKKEFWEEMAGLRGQQGCKWCMIRDSNSIVNQGEKNGGNAGNIQNVRWYLNFIETTSMIEMLIKGGSFTWSNQRTEENAISEKLDRIFFTGEWSFMHPKAIGIMEAATTFDHNPILLLLNGPRKKRKNVFKFESKWLLEEDCSANIKEAWSLDTEVPRSLSSSQFGKKLRTTRIKLGRWIGPDICPTQPRVTEHWTPPSTGYVKASCDASYDSTTGNASAAMVFRNDKGQIVGGVTSSFIVSSATCAEATAIRLGVIKAIDVGLRQVVAKAVRLGSCPVDWQVRVPPGLRRLL
ncbi:hypothetical protein V6N11_052655 [Hibiscus sabdariffa]|uniref:RNase H type-1 domain-containing protein n=1 Tax=Hibiscus sabdariffa TaxID=183260 RepID=A0ABR2UB63_9ROSI